MTTALCFFFSDNKTRHRNDREVRIYIATKLFQFASRKEPFVILVGPGRLFPALFAPAIAYGPHTGFFSIVFSVKGTRGRMDHTIISSLILNRRIKSILPARWYII